MFDGQTFDYSQDFYRLTNSLDRVAWYMSDGGWRPLSVIAKTVRSSEAGVSARLRDLRKPRFAAIYNIRNVESKRVKGGLWVYRVTLGYRKPQHKQGELFA